MYLETGSATRTEETVWAGATRAPIPEQLTHQRLVVPGVEVNLRAVMASSSGRTKSGSGVSRASRTTAQRLRRSTSSAIPTM